MKRRRTREIEIRNCSQEQEIEEPRNPTVHNWERWEKSLILRIVRFKLTPQTGDSRVNDLHCDNGKDYGGYYKFERIQ